jgi:hypothetical protein
MKYPAGQDAMNNTFAMLEVLDFLFLSLALFVLLKAAVTTGSRFEWGCPVNPKNA